MYWAGSRLGTALGIAAAYAVLTVVMTWPFVNYGHFASATYGGDARLIIWTLAWDNHAVLNGLPVFDSNIFFPAPHSLRYNEHLLGVSLATLPWAAAGASPVLAYNVTWWLAFFLNGLVAFAWLRRFVADRLAAFAGSLVFACSFYVMLHAHGHLHLIWLWPLPASALLLERWFARPTAMAAAAWLAVVLMGILTSWYIAVIVALVNVATFVVLVVSSRETSGRELWRRRVGHLACAAVVTVAVVYPMARPYVGLKANPGEAAYYAADVASYLVPPENTLAGGWWKAHIDARPRPIYGEQTLFAGWIALTLGLIGLLTLVRGAQAPPAAWVCPVLVVVGFLLSLGPSPLLLGGPALAPFGWLASLPGFSGMRAPGRFAMLAMMGLSGLAALGAAAIKGRLGRFGAICVAALIPLMLVEWFVVGFGAGKPQVHPIPPIYQTPQVRSARAIASLPEYRDRSDWPKGGDYLYYSTAHWRPIVNGFGRTEPPGQAAVVQAVRDFALDPRPARALGIQYIVVHAARLEGAERGLVEAALANPLCRLATQIGDDYLFELLDAPVRAAR
jgi:hypothetical protein